MEFENYSERARGFVQSAQNLALREGHQKFSPLHLLKVLLDDDQGLTSGLVKSAGGDLASAKTEVATLPWKNPSCFRRWCRPALYGS